MTRTNMKVSEIRKLWREEKPLYHDTNDYGVIKRYRIHGMRTWNGQFQVKLYFCHSMIWINADPKQVVLAY